MEFLSSNACEKAPPPTSFILGDARYQLKCQMTETALCFTSDLGIVCDSDPTLVIICLHGNFSCTPGPMSED